MEKMESQGLHLPCLGQRCPILISFSLFDYYVSCTLHPSTPPLPHSSYFIYPARAQSARARRACALRALGLLLADGTPTVGGGKTF